MIVLICALLLGFTAPALAADNPANRNAFVEDLKSERNPYVDAMKKSRADQESVLDKAGLIQGAKHVYREFNNRVRVPGFISAAPMPQLARIIGPKKSGSMLAHGDTLYIRWAGAPMPRVNDRYSVYSPAIVTQNLLQPTDFSVMKPLGRLDKLPKDNRLAGWFYESTGRIRVIRIRNGLVEATLEQVKGPIEVGDEIMPELPLLKNVMPIRSGIQLTAAVVCGNPWDRLSTTKRSFIYINRGSRDGIRVGRVFESIENVGIDQAIGGPAPLVSNGEAIVIHTTDSYSTAMITKQFDVIRIGSLLRTRQETSPISPDAPFEGFQDEAAKFNTRLKEEDDLIPIVPSTENLPNSIDPSLPEPRRSLPEPALSELDSLEKRLNAKELTESERARLDKLSRQEKVREQKLTEIDDELETPATPSLENSFKDSKKISKKDQKKSKKSKKNDEEELNQLMMEN
jgi:hypothetical protein